MAGFCERQQQAVLKCIVCLFLLIYQQAGTRQVPYWAINAKPTYCRSPQTLVKLL